MISLPRLSRENYTKIGTIHALKAVGSIVSSVGKVPDSLITRLRVRISLEVRCCVLEQDISSLLCLVLGQPRNTSRHD